MKEITHKKRESKPVLPDYKSMDRITVFTRAEDGSIFGLVSIDRHCILDVTYNAIEGVLAIGMKSMSFRGNTSVTPVQNVKVEQGQSIPVNSYTVHDLYTMEGFNHTLTIKDEEEIRKIWTWLGHDEDMPFSTLLKIRQDMLEKIAVAKQKARERKEAEEKAMAKEAEEAENKKKGKILTMDGVPAK